MWKVCAKTAIHKWQRLKCKDYQKSYLVPALLHYWNDIWIDHCEYENIFECKLWIMVWSIVNSRTIHEPWNDNSQTIHVNLVKNKNNRKSEIFWGNKKSYFFFDITRRETCCFGPFVGIKRWYCWYRCVPLSWCFNLSFSFNSLWC